MEVNNDETITLSRGLSDLDKFVVNFCSILEKHFGYTLISGYVAILFGRSRGTEDVDMFIERIPFDVFLSFYQDLLRNGFWALNADDPKELYSMLEDNLAIRFAKKEKTIPNMKIKFVKDLFDNFSLRNKRRVLLEGGKHLWISGIPLQVAYKRYVLKAPKDLEDAQFLQKVFNISEDVIITSKRVLEEHGKI